MDCEMWLGAAMIEVTNMAGFHNIYGKGVILRYGTRRIGVLRMMGLKGFVNQAIYRPGFLDYFSDYVALLSTNLILHLFFKHDHM